MRKVAVTGLSLILVAVGCTKSPGADDAGSKSEPSSPSTAQASDPAPATAVAGVPANAGPALKPGGGLIAEPSGVKGTLSITIGWSAEIVTGDDNIGKTTTVYKRSARLECPVTSSDEASFSYFGFIDNPDNDDPFASTGSYQQWLNENCTGTLTINDTYHADDPTLAGPEPVVKSTGTRQLKTADIPMTIETDLNRGRTRYLFLSPSADGFQQEAAPGYPATVVAASAAPLATMDFTLEGPIGDGKREVVVEGGILNVDWTFTR